MQLYLYKEYSHQLSLTDTIKISLLQKAVSGALHLKVVKTQTDMLSRFIDAVSEMNFAGYCKLPISAAKNCDAKIGPNMPLQNRRMKTHLFYHYGYDDTIDPYDIDMDIHTILINVARTHASCIPHECWNQISMDSHTIWRQIPNVDCTIILKGCPDDTGLTDLMPPPPKDAIGIPSLVHMIR
jgi:hypothetical protein